MCSVVNGGDSSFEKTMAVTAERSTVADVFLAALADAGIDYLFTVLGSDHPSIVEAYHKRKKNGCERPHMLIFQHEMVAISAADGYARTTRRPQCVIVHVDVGTSALGQGLHNASSGKVPMLIFAGQAPHTLYGEMTGSRSEHVQWYQDCPNQAAIVAPFARYTNEIKCAAHVRMMVNRALYMANTGCPGPTYLTATREALAAETSSTPGHAFREHVPDLHLGGMPEPGVKLIAEALTQAEKPLVVTGYLGRDHGAVAALIKLTAAVPGLRVFDFEAREMSFPADNPAYIVRGTGAGSAIKEADIILVIDADVPWIPTKLQPSANARIFHIDIDPRKENMMLFDIFAEATYFADAKVAILQLHDHVVSQDLISKRAEWFAKRTEDLREAHAAGISFLKARAEPREDGKISSNYLFASLRRLLSNDRTVYASDVVTNQIPFSEQLQLSTPGSHMSKGGSGLGWAGGAAIGIRLALDRYDVTDRPNVRAVSGDGSDKPKLVCSITGDGSFIFGVPSATFWAQYKLETPILNIVLNNGGWKATRSSINDVHPGGLSASMTEDALGIDLSEEGPDYVGIAVAASAGKMFGLKVSSVAGLDDAIAAALRAVEGEKRSAILEVFIV